MSTQQNREERLWNYIDGSCPAAEQLIIEQLIATDVQWKAKYEELRELHTLLGSHLELDEPSMRFTQNVMEAIGREHIAPAARSYINKRVIWGIATLFILSLLGILLYGIGQINWSQDGSSSWVSASRIHLNKIDFSKLVNNTYITLFMMVNTVLGLVVLDLYLSRNKKKYYQ